MRAHRIHAIIVACGMVLNLTPLIAAQVVNVTMTLDESALMVGEETVLRVWAQVKPEYQAQADRIFSWWIDIVNTNGSVAALVGDQLTMIASDNEPAHSSSGTMDGAHIRGIHNTFMDLAGAGVGAPVELLAVPLRAEAAGVVTVGATGGTVGNLAFDFIVAPLDVQGDMMTGGDYSAAGVTLTVFSPEPASLRIERESGGMQLAFDVLEGYYYEVHFADSLLGSPRWRPVAGAPHQTGIVPFVVERDPLRVFRLVRYDEAPIRLSLERVPGGIRISFFEMDGMNYQVEYTTDSLGGEPNWTAFPASPHASGFVDNDLSALGKTYRVIRLP